MSKYTTVAKVGAIPEGRGQAFTVNERLVAVFRTPEGYFAIDDLCPHMGASLADGDVHDGMVCCPWHAWRFSVKDGGWIDNPRIKVDRFDVRIEDGMIQVRVPD